MATWQVGQGAQASYRVTIKDGTGAAITTYTGAEPLAGKIWPGRDQPATFAPTVTWADPASGTVNVNLDAASTAIAEPGLYQVVVTVTDGTGEHDAYRGLLEVDARPGTASVPAVYTSFADLLDYAPWAEDLQAQDPDQATTGFLRKRARARSWLDDVIVSRYKVASMSPQIGQPGFLPWSYYLNTWDQPPSKWLRDQLAANLLMVTDLVKEIVSKRALFYICQPQIGIESKVPHQTLAGYFAIESEELVKTYRAEIDLNGDGWADLLINCGATNLR